MAFKPNEKSLANLAPKFTKENAKVFQERSVEARKRNKEARERLQLTAQELKLDIDALMEETGISAIGVLRLAMIKAVQENDMDEATRLAAQIAEYEMPKLARVDAVNTDLSTEDLTDEELDAKLRELGLKD